MALPVLLVGVGPGLGARRAPHTRAVALRAAISHPYYILPLRPLHRTSAIRRQPVSIPRHQPVRPFPDRREGRQKEHKQPGHHDPPVQHRITRRRGDQHSDHKVGHRIEQQHHPKCLESRIDLLPRYQIHPLGSLGVGNSVRARRRIGRAARRAAPQSRNAPLQPLLLCLQKPQSPLFPRRLLKPHHAFPGRGLILLNHRSTCLLKLP